MKRVLFGLLAVSLLLIVCVFTGCRSSRVADIRRVSDTFSLPGEAVIKDSGEGGGAAYKGGSYCLNPQDQIAVELLGIPEEKRLEMSINEHGEITMPYLEGPIVAQGLTTSALARKICDLYIENKIYRDITINVATSAKTYYLEGEVRLPQEYPLGKQMTVLQAIAAAGGYTEYANTKKITITRRGTRRQVSGKRLERHPEEDIIIEPDDRIKIHRSIW